MLRFSLRAFAASLSHRRRYRVRRQRRSCVKVAIVEAMEDRTLLSGMPPMSSPETHAVPYDSFDTVALSKPSVLSNDYDWESDPLTAVLHTDVANGTLTFSSNGHFVYTPDAGFEGTDTFKYRAFDGTGYGSVTTVTLNVSIAFSDRINLDDRPVAAANGASLFTGGFGTNMPVAPGINLVYQSDTDPNPVIAVEAELEVSTWADDVEVDLLLDTIQGGTIYYDGAYYSGLAYRFAHQVDASSLSTGRYDYEMSIVANYGSASSTRVISGTTHIVNRNASEFGAGWWVQELDQLVIDTGGVLHVTGDGVASWFEDDNGTFVAPAGPLAHSTLVENQDGTYTLTDQFGNEANFDADGLLTDRVDRNGNTRTYTYTDADSDTVADELWKITDAFSRVTTFAYTSGLLSSVTDIDGRVTTVAHDGSDRLTSVTQPDPDGAGAQSAPVTTYAYDGSTNRLSSITDPLSRETEIEYDFAGLVDEITYADSTTSGLDAWQSRGLVNTSVSGSQGSPAGFFLPNDPLVNSGAEVLDPLANASHFALDHFGLVTSSSNALGELTTYERNANGQVTKMTLPNPAGPQAAPVTNYTYDTDGNLTQITNPDSTTIVMVYSASNFLTSRKDELDRETTYTHDSYGNVLTMTDPEGNVTSYDYDSGGRVIEITMPDPDGAGALAAPVIEYEYDSYGRLTEVTNPDATTVTYAYDTADRVTSVTDELSRVTSYTYDELDRLLTVTLPDPDGAGAQTAPVTTYTYDAVGNLLTMVDALGNTTSYEYDDRNRLIEVTLPDPDGAGAQTAPVLERAYNNAGWLTSTTDALGNVTTYGYDDVGRLTSMSQPDPDGAGAQVASVTSYLLDNLGRVTRITDPLGFYTYFEYDSRDRVTKRTDPDPDAGGALTSPETEWAYDDAGQVTSITDPLNRVTSYEYDDNGRLTKTTMPDPDGGGAQSAPEITRAYDKLGRLITLTDPLGNATTYEYDITSRLIKQTDPDPDGAGALTSPITQWAYDDAGQLTTLTDLLGEVTTYAYDNLGRQTSVTLPDPDGAGGQTAAVVTTTYDALGNVLTQTDALSNTTEYEYDNLSRLVLSTDPELGETSFAYDANGNMTSLTDPVGNVTTWAFDNLNRTTSETNELSDVRSWTYDKAGNVLTATDRNGRVVEFTYDRLQRLTQEVWKQSSTTVNTIDYTYDAASQLTAIEDDDSAYTWTYDNLGRVTQIDNVGTGTGPNVVLTSTYNAAGRRTSVRAEVDSTDDFINTYGYDNLGRMTHVQQVEPASGNSVAEKRVDFAYNAAGQYSTITRWADITQTDLVAATTFTYDEAHRLTGLSHDQGMTNLADYAWTYDTSGRITSVTTVDGTDDYTYDDNGQLIDVDSDYQTDEAWTYDANGNRTNSGYTTGDNNRLTSDGTYNYEYDDEGNRTEKTHISSGDYVEYDWDHRNRLTSVTFRNSSDVKTKEVTYMYDVFDRRIAKDVDDDGDSTIDWGERYVYDGSDIALVYDRSDDLLERLLYGPGVDQPLASGDASGDVLWFLADNQGTVRDVAEYDAVSGDTTVVNHITYGGFGNITGQSNSSHEPRHTYTGREWDADSELFYYRARWFDPVVGRFISEDPIGFAAADANINRYVGNSPTNFRDPTGRWADPNDMFDLGPGGTTIVPVPGGTPYTFSASPQRQVEARLRIAPANRSTVLGDAAILGRDDLPQLNAEAGRRIGGNSGWSGIMPPGTAVGPSGCGPCLGIALIPPDATTATYVLHMGTDVPPRDALLQAGFLSRSYQQHVLPLDGIWVPPTAIDVVPPGYSAVLCGNLNDPDYPAGNRLSLLLLRDAVQLLRHYDIPVSYVPAPQFLVDSEGTIHWTITSDDYLLEGY